MAPNSSHLKPAFVNGTTGIHQTEEELNLNVSLKLENKLKKLGATVYMVRTTHECSMSNIDRAKFASKHNADLTLRIHADGTNYSEISGILMLIPSATYINDKKMLADSKRAGDFILKEVVNETGAINRGIVPKDDFTGFNWATVPTILLEIGVMTNPKEDYLLETEEYQQKIIKGITNGIVKYFNNK